MEPFNISFVFAAMWVSETWNERRAKLSLSDKPTDKRRALHARTRAVVVHDRVLNDRVLNDRIFNWRLK